MLLSERRFWLLKQGCKCIMMRSARAAIGDQDQDRRSGSIIGIDDRESRIEDWDRGSAIGIEEVSHSPIMLTLPYLLILLTYLAYLTRDKNHPISESVCPKEKRNRNRGSGSRNGDRGSGSRRCPIMPSCL